MNVLVTGSTGYLGKQLIQQLVSEGHTVTNLSRRDSHQTVGISSSWVLGQSIPSSVLCRNDVLVHLAWSTVSRTTPDFHANVGGSKQLIQSAHDHGLRVVFISSISAINPVSSYGRAKHLVEGMLNETDSIVRVGLVHGNLSRLDSVQRSKVLRLVPFIPVPGGNLLVSTTSVSSFLRTAGPVICGENLSSETLIVDQVEELKSVVARSTGKRTISLPAKFSFEVLKLLSRLSQRGMTMRDAFQGLLSSQNQKIHNDELA